MDGGTAAAGRAGREPATAGDDGDRTGVAVPDGLAELFDVRARTTDDDGGLVLYGRLDGGDGAEGRLWRLCHEAGYRSELSETAVDGLFELRLVPRGRSGWRLRHSLALGLTVLTTLAAGASWYGVDAFADPPGIAVGWRFSAGLLFVLGTHELGHYVASRLHDVDASAPLFVPFPSFIGTMGAVIDIRSRFPDRTALFDIGIAGPIAGLVPIVLTAAAGLLLGPVESGSVVGPAATGVEIGYPPLIRLVAAVLDRPLDHPSPYRMVHPFVVAASVGAFVTFLNLLPVGQLDGGHMARALLGEAQATIGGSIPWMLVTVGLYVLFYTDQNAAANIWFVWGLLAVGFARRGSSEPIDDRRLGDRRSLLGFGTFVVGVLCFTPAPFVVA